MNLTDLNGILFFPFLEILIANWNKIESLKEISSCPYLIKLDLAFNRISNVWELENLKTLQLI